MTADLPFIDEHSVLVQAPARVVWCTLVRNLPTLHGTPLLLLRAWGLQPLRATGILPETGATIPGFVITESVPDCLLRLTGRHRFSRYELVWELTSQPEGTWLAARSFGEFPGPTGFLYRLAVIGSGAHGVLVPWLLRRVRHQAER